MDPLDTQLIKNNVEVSFYAHIVHHNSVVSVVSKDGVFAIETKNHRGVIYGDDNRKEWILSYMEKGVLTFNEHPFD